jgi:hypothetical protein
MQRFRNAAASRHLEASIAGRIPHVPQAARYRRCLSENSQHRTDYLAPIRKSFDWPSIARQLKAWWDAFPFSHRVERNFSALHKFALVGE